ncbi:peptidase C13 family-domain-containing protein [Naematelia encephala]|uniref:Peptidase C13 family-domain-containing protein n=1 Tax=Naematelia encephala TaxID=71784 RepID=A0A1Y2ARD9_9TREE|nr:peptidase C13 family-domain-containing protein [Naematelia encephala]
MQPRPSWLSSALLLSALLALLTTASALSHEVEKQVTDLFTSNGTVPARHTNNWAVLVCSSRYWFNYRHMANTLAMYRTLKRLGMPDSNIILMLADDVACNARNSFPATVYANSGRQMDLYGDWVEVDYRGYEVTVESFLRLLTGRQPAYTPPNKRLLTDASSNVFIYMTGHGGDEFLKFQDNEEISAFDLADAIEQMSEKRRFNKLLYVVDTCQANTMYSKIYSPNVISSGSSAIGENSYSHHNDLDIGVAVIDSYTHYILQYLETTSKTSKATLQDFFNTYDPARIHSHPGISTELSSVAPEEILVTDFFGGVASIEIMSRDKELPIFARGLTSWKEVRRVKSIGGDQREAWQARRPLGSAVAAGGWDRPLSEDKDIWESLRGVGTAVALGVAIVAWSVSGSESRKNKVE